MGFHQATLCALPSQASTKMFYIVGSQQFVIQTAAHLADWIQIECSMPDLSGFQRRR